MARRKGKKTGLVDPEDVLAGRISATVEELFELIHRVNPTDRDLPRGETARRYSLKSALQSLLLREHRDELRIVAEDDQVVSIRHRYGGGDACHAIVSELDVDVRAWVRRCLDEREVAPERPKTAPAAQRLDAKKDVAPERDQSPDVETLDVPGLLAAGSTALAGWDYDAARERFTSALHRSGGALATALPLLELLVDHMGLDDEALALARGGELGGAALADAEVRGLLAVAAARQGDVPTAAAFVQGLEGERAAGCCLILARAAIAADDEAEASRWLGEARRREAPQADLAAIEESLRALRASRRAPLESAAAAALDGGDLEAAERLAQELDQQWPESAIVRRIRTEVEQRRRRERLHELLARAHEAATAGDTRRAIALLRDAIVHGAGPEVIERLAALERGAKADEDAAAVARVVELLGGPDRATALREYLSLGDALRARVAAGSPVAELGWLEEMGAPRTGASARAAIDAALALRSATDALAAGRVDMVESILSPHERALRGVSSAKRLLAEAAEVIARARLGDARTRVGLARAAFDEGRASDARALLTGVDTKLLSDEARREVDRLDAELRRLEHVTQLATALEQTADLLARRRIVSQLVALDSSDSNDRWVRLGDELAEQLRAEWKVAVHDGDGLDLVGAVPYCTISSVEVWLAPGGDEVVIATPLSDRLFVWVVRLADQVVRNAVTLRVPEPLGKITSYVVDGSILLVGGEKGALLRLSRTSWDVLEWRSLTDFTEEGELLEYIYFLPGTRYLWFETSVRRSGVDTTTRIVDLDAWRVHRVMGETHQVELLLGASPRLLGSDQRRSARVFAPHGSPVPPRIREGMEVSGAAAAPDGRSVLLLHHRPGQGSDDDDRSLEASLVSEDGTMTEPFAFSDADYESGHAIASARDSGLVFVIHDADDRAEIASLRCAGTHFEPVWRAESSLDAVFIQDPEGAKVALAEWDPVDGLRLAPLSDTPPATRFEPSGSRLFFSLQGDYFCSLKVREHDDRYHTLSDRLGAMKPGDRRDTIERLRRGDVDEHLDLARALKYHRGGPSHLEEARRVHERFPDHPGATLILADFEAEGGSWSRCRELLEGAPTSGLPDIALRHLGHLLGIARLRDGDLEGARAAWEDALSHGGTCRVASYMDLVTPPSGDRDRSPIRHLVPGVRTADHLLGAGRFEEAVGALEQPWIFRLEELQSLARLAEAYLQLDREDAPFRFRKTLALAAFCQVFDSRESEYRNELSIAGLAWPADRLLDLHRRVRVWLDGT